MNRTIFTVTVFTLMLATCSLCDPNYIVKRGTGCEGCKTRMCMYLCSTGKRNVDMQDLYEKKGALPVYQPFGDHGQSGTFKNRFYQYLSANRGNPYHEVDVESDY